MYVSQPPRRNHRLSSEPASEGALPPLVRLKVTLLEVVPPIWRRFQVPVNFTLRRLHVVLQQVMGWKDSHPHQFRVGNQTFGMPSDDSEGLKDSRWITLQELVSRGTRILTYEYASGEGWQHEIRIEGLAEGNPTNQRPLCLAGERTCPPENSGGPEGYVEILEARREPWGSSRAFLVEQLDPHFDPEAFDLDEINAALSALTF
jgi:hypothetical protein